MKKTCSKATKYTPFCTRNPRFAISNRKYHNSLCTSAEWALTRRGQKDRKARAVELGTEDEENILCGIWRCEACLSGGMKAEKSAGSAAGARIRRVQRRAVGERRPLGVIQWATSRRATGLRRKQSAFPRGRGRGRGTARHGRLGPAGAKTVGCCRPAMEKDGVRWRSDLRAVDVQEATGR